MRINMVQSAEWESTECDFLRNSRHSKEYLYFYVHSALRTLGRTDLHAASQGLSDYNHETCYSFNCMAGRTTSVPPPLGPNVMALDQTLVNNSSDWKHHIATSDLLHSPGFREDALT